MYRNIKLGGRNIITYREEKRLAKVILETPEWLVYDWLKGYKVCDGDEAPELSSLLYFEHKEKGIVHRSFSSIADYSVDEARNTIVGKLQACNLDRTCCYRGKAEIKVSPTPSLPSNTFSAKAIGREIPLEILMWTELGEILKEENTKLCYPDHCESYKYPRGLKDIRGKALGGIQAGAGFGHMNTSVSERCHWLGSGAKGQPILPDGAVIFTYRCADSFPCPKLEDRIVPGVSDTCTHYVFTVDPTEEAMMEKVGEIVELMPPLPVEYTFPVALGSAVAAGALTGYVIGEFT